jgi:nicotinate-nucleotide pyrophosphorylase (carboxylating)
MDKKIWKDKAVEDLVARALEEDLGGEDITTALTVPASCRAEAKLLSREEGIAAGLPLLGMVFGRLDKRVRVRLKTPEGGVFAPGSILAELSGPARALLSGERVALNFLQRLCGIASLTSRFVEAVRFSKAAILDTRKTTPGLRRLEKYAVTCGGGVNHRGSLAEAILIKDNHIKAAGGLERAVALARQYTQGSLPIEVEAENLAEVEQALGARAEIILLDNMSPALLRQAVGLVRGRALTEASGGVSLETVGETARSGVDRISIGALTHSVKACDLSIEFSSILQK